MTDRGGAAAAAGSGPGAAPESERQMPFPEPSAGGPEAAVSASQADGWWRQQAILSRVAYWGLHASCLLVFWVGFQTSALWLLLATFFVRMFAITGGYHRYFSHRAFRTSRAFQLVLAVLGATATQKGALWWAGHHRIHHKHSDRPGRDVHSPRDGFWYSHQGWIFDGRWDDSPLDQVRDFAAYPELVWLNRWHIAPPIAMAALLFLFGGASAVVWGYCVSTVLLWHATYSINSLAHRWGTRRYDTSDDSRNNWLLGLLTFGEGWHNNHHHYCTSARQGFRWWEVDLTYYLLRGLAAIGVVWEIREPPHHVVDGGPASL
jgi:stearoyl-CoA desaturase (delta-9 desaturase)